MQAQYGIHTLLRTSTILRGYRDAQLDLLHLVCNKYSRKESVRSMLDDLEWPPLQQRRAESRLALFHRIVIGTVDIDSAVLMKESRRPSRKTNKVQNMRRSSKKDCYKYSFVPRSIVQWNNINVPDDHAQFKSILSTVDLCIGGDTYNYKY